MLEQLGDLGGHRELIVYQGIWNYLNILLLSTMTTLVGIGLMLTVWVPIFSITRKSYIKMARW